MFAFFHISHSFFFCLPQCVLILESLVSDFVCTLPGSLCDSEEVLKLKKVLLEFDSIVDGKLSGLVKKCASRGTQLKCMEAK